MKNENLLEEHDLGWASFDFKYSTVQCYWLNENSVSRLMHASINVIIGTKSASKEKFDIGIRFLNEKDNCKAKVLLRIGNWRFRWNRYCMNTAIWCRQITINAKTTWGFITECHLLLHPTACASLRSSSYLLCWE